MANSEGADMRMTTGEQLREMAKLLPRYEVTTENADVFRARIAELEALLGEANTILEIGESINPGCVLHSEIKAALAKKELSA